jgi:hypothetical protein
MNSINPYIKFACFSIIFIPEISMSQWNLSINNAGGSTDYSAILPFSYSSSTCLFDFDVLANGLEALHINNTDQCQNDAFLVLDGYQYPFNNSFTLTYDADSVDIPFGINLDSCVTTSGNPIASNAPHLIVNIILIQLNPNFDHHVIHVDDDTHFVFESSNQDIVCSGGIPVDLIFSGGFE